MGRMIRGSVTWHDLTANPKDLPEPGERVIIVVDDTFIGEGYVKNDDKWYRYCDFGPVDEFMKRPVTWWGRFPEIPMREIKKKKESKKQA